MQVLGIFLHLKSCIISDLHGNDHAPEGSLENFDSTNNLFDVICRNVIL